MLTTKNATHLIELQAHVKCWLDESFEMRISIAMYDEATYEKRKSLVLGKMFNVLV